MNHPADIKRLAVSVAPHVGGLFTYYLRLCNALESDGIETFCVELGDESSRWNEYIPYSGSDHRRVEIDAHGKSASLSFVDWVIREEIDAVFLSPASPIDIFASLPHLPASVRAFVRLSEISPFNYRRALQYPDALDGLIVNCPRQADDLSAKYDLVRSKLTLIPNGVDMLRFAPASSPRKTSEPISILFLDRIHDIYKNALLLPKILRELDTCNIPWRFTIAGDGPDKDKLMDSLAPWLQSEHVTTMGWLDWNDVPALMAQHDVYLKLSRSEASPSSLMEAMACGLVPISSRIEGVTDFIVRDGVDGILARTGNVKAIAQAITALASDRERLRQLSLSARSRIEQEFSAAMFGHRIRAFFRSAPAVSQRTPLPWSAYRSPSLNERSLFRRYLTKTLPLAWRIRIREALGVN